MSGNAFPNELEGLDFEVALDPVAAELDEAYSELSGIQDLLHNACGVYRYESTDDAAAGVNAAANQLGAAFGATLETVIKLMAPSEVDQAIFGLLGSQDSTNIAQFQALTSREGLYEASDKSLWAKIEKLKKITHTTEEFIEHLKSYFCNALEQDLTTFSQKARAAYELEQQNTITIILAKIAIQPTEIIDQGQDDSRQAADASSDEAAAGTYFTFSIQPKLNPHDVDFMGDHVYLSHSQLGRTNGTIFVPDTELISAEEEEREDAKFTYLYEKFHQYLNPLGEMTIRFGIKSEDADVVDDEMTEEEEDDT